MRKRNHYSSNRNNNGQQNNGQGGQGGQGNNYQNRNRMRRPHNNGQGGNANQGNLMLDGEVINPRQRHNAKNNRDKYLNQARDMLSMGDRVKAEYYFQHADHYQRIINVMEEHRAQQQRDRGIEVEENTSDAEGDDMHDTGATMTHAMPSPSEVYADQSFPSQHRGDNSDDRSHGGDERYGDGDDYAPRQQQQQRRPQQQQQQRPQREYREPRPQREPREPREQQQVQPDMLASVEDAPVVREPRQPRVERPQQPRAPRPEVAAGEAPRRGRPPRQPRVETVENPSDHGSQLEALLPAPKNTL